VDLSFLFKQHRQWEELLPRVEPFYAIKCNPDKAFLEVLASLGTGFDCASKEEIRLVKECGVANSKIIYANPCKSRTHILKAREEGVKMMTFDNLDELKKIHKLYREAELVLRILPDDSHSLMKFGSKFGAPQEIWEELLQEARELDLNVIGVSFHVGSGCYDAIAFSNTLHLARQLFDFGEKFGFKFTLLDIGGGYPGCSNVTPSFAQIANVIRPLLDELFPSSVRVISEPGRYYAASTTTFVTSIHSRRLFFDELNSKSFKYYIGDGVYGSFNCIFFDHAQPLPSMVFPSNEESQNGDKGIFKSTIFGPTCDSMDKIAENIFLPELKVGEWIYFPDFGAYTTAAASSFNGFDKSNSFYIFQN